MGLPSGPEPELSGREFDEKSGRVLGGTSSINAMIFNRGNPLDYDGWAADGLAGWDYAHCLPYFKRMETFADGGDDWRGGSGPMQVSRSPAKHKLYDALLESGVQSGWGVTSDHNGYRQEGMHIAQDLRSIAVCAGAQTGPTCARARRPNLHVLSKTHVTRVLIADGSAVGIEVADGPVRNQDLGPARGRALRRCVRSPKLLMLSGIGPADELRRPGIPVLADVAQVGQT